MPTVNLTARLVASIKPSKARTEYFDSAMPGLALRVTPTGAKSWTVLYRHRGRLRRLTLGSESVVTLAAARDRARDELHGVTKGADPATVKQDGRKAETIADLADTYIERWAKPRKRSWKADDNLLRKKILPAWKQRAIRDITRQDVIRLVDGVAETAPIVANRVAALLSKMFAFALDRDLVTASPAVRIPRPGTEQARDRVLTEDELRALWKAFSALEPPMAAFYKLRLVTAQRGGEVASMRWRDVDLESAWWTIPSASSKNKLAHRVPLSQTALDLITALQHDKSKPEDFVLEGARGKRQQAEAAAMLPVKDFRGHDLRRTAASLMVGSGVSRLTVSKILNHVERSVTAVYDRHSYDAEKRAALDGWALSLASIGIAKKPKGAAVVRFRRRSAR
ncbi:MAG: tyrosine-type recombinase/integrase [Acidobacteria bacterium]|nr:tyrosine-type recombinase/integrase [Acidobacteriota bacterium]